MRRALGATAPGEPVNGRGIEGHLERSLDRHLLVRVDRPVPGYVSFSAFDSDVDASGVYVQGYLFSDVAPSDTEREQASWQAWLEDVAAAVTLRPA